MGVVQDDLRRVPAPEEVDGSPDDEDTEGTPLRHRRQPERPFHVRAQLPVDEVTAERERARQQVTAVGDDVDAQRRAEQHQQRRAHHVEGHGVVGHAMAVLVLEPARQLPVLGGLVERPAHAHDGVQHRQRQRQDQRDPDEPLLPRSGPEDMVGIAEVQRQRVGAGQHQPEHRDEHQRRHDVDEHPEQAFGGQRDLGVPGAAPALADVAGGGLHRDHVPEDREEPGRDERQADVDSGRRVEAGYVVPVDRAGLEERQEDHHRDRHHRQHA